jgi:starch synthase
MYRFRSYAGWAGRFSGTCGEADYDIEEGGKNMRILFAAAEAVPFIKTGGLADVIGSLPKELQRQGIDVRVVLPKFKSIPAFFTENMTRCTAFTVPVGWRRQYTTVEELKWEGVTYYFIDNEYYFWRDGVYGCYDEAEQFAFFSRAVFEVLPYIGWKPDIIHCHDWHTAIVPVFLHTFYKDHPFYARMRTVFTIHNLKYQGIFPYIVLPDVLGLDNSYFTLDGLEFYGNINYMKGGLLYADRITTVSPGYAQEIQDPYYGEKLDGVLRSRASKLTGIINGIDYDVYNPQSDTHIYVNYRYSTAKKQKNKIFLQQQLRLPLGEHIPLVAIVSRLVEQKGFDLLACVLEELLSMDMQLVVLGTGEARYEEMFREAAHRYPDKLAACIQFDEEFARCVYAAADLFLMPSQFEPCGISQMIALRYGAVPIVRETGGLRDTVQSYNEMTGEGNGFTFANYNAHDMLYTIKRALSVYHNKEVFAQVLRNGRETDCSWIHSARQYHMMYEQLVTAGEVGHDVFKQGKLQTAIY